MIGPLDPGRREILVRVAGATYRIMSPDPEGPELQLLEASCRFEVPENGSPDIDLRARWGDLRPESPGTAIFDSGGCWGLFRDQAIDVFRFWAGPRPARPFLECRLPGGGWAGEVIVDRASFGPEEPVPALQYPLDEVLMMHWLGAGRGIELHACGVVTPEGTGYLYVGQSGDGKSTTARLWEQFPGTIILSDDRIVVREEHGRYVMHGTPWHGEARLAANWSAPIDAVFVLEHGRANELSPLSGPDAVARLAARSFVPFHDGVALQWSLGFLGGFTASVSCYAFAFLPDRSAIEYVRSATPDPSRRSDSQESTADGGHPATVDDRRAEL